MWKNIVLIVVLLHVANGHFSNLGPIKKLQNEIKDLQDDQATIFNMIYTLETTLTEMITSQCGGNCNQGVTGKIANIGLDENFEVKLTELEGKVNAIKSYLMGEKTVDILLREKSEEVIQEMENKVTETENVIETLKADVQNSLTVFDDKIESVNKTANVKINANGAVLYGGIGSACTKHGGECYSADSECRGGRCQCSIGLSYDIQARACVDTCITYGKTYQSVDYRIIRGYNDNTLENVTLADCTKYCNEETSFLCKSFDYFQQWRTCYFSSNVKSEVPEDAWEYNSEGCHFQRDCR